MTFKDLLDRFTGAVEAGDGNALGAVFTEDGVYHDVYYGAFQGRAAIADMLANRFHRDARDFRWEMIDPLDDGRIGYARRRFSFTSTVAQSDGRRVLMEGVGVFRLRDGLIESYADVAKAGEAMVQTGNGPEKLHGIFTKWAEAQWRQPEAAAHK